MKQMSLLRFMLLCLVGAMACSGAEAQDKASREREALKRAQQQVQQIRQEKASIEEKLSGFEQEKDKLASQLSGAQARAKSAANKNQQLQTELDTATQEKKTLEAQKTDLEKQLAELTAKHTELTAKQANTERELAQTRSVKVQTESDLKGRVQQLASCEDKNVKLYTYGRDLIKQCTDRSSTDMVLRLEPFTCIKRVGLENVLEEYRDKLDAQKIISADTPK
jgi:chromosome segregation ATPase